MKKFLTANWKNLIMVNYAIDPKVLLPYLPKGVELDYYNGNAYVSLVGFMFKDSKIFRVPIPRLGTFEEINLRFYVTRKEGNEIKRGVVFINETVPYKIVAYLANKLYNENYIAIPTKHYWNIDTANKHIKYEWKVNKIWSSIEVITGTEKLDILKNSFEEFIFQHYYGYTKISDTTSEEYTIGHPSWQINKVIKHQINCDFEKVYGKDFKILNGQNPASVMLAEGSDISIDWKRNPLVL